MERVMTESVLDETLRTPPSEADGSRAGAAGTADAAGAESIRGGRPVIST
jgi:hypothetical protein